MIDVKVRVYANLRQYLPDLSLGQSAELSFQDGSTIGDVLDSLSIPRKEVKQCFVNGLHRELDYALHSQDELAFFSPIGGG